jgi:hypothetical protein
MDVPPQGEHSAIIGISGCRYVVTQEIKGSVQVINSHYFHYSLKKAGIMCVQGELRL